MPVNLATPEKDEVEMGLWYAVTNIVNLCRAVIHPARIVYKKFVIYLLCEDIKTYGIVENLL